jgi:hypothetical protein
MTGCSRFFDKEGQQQVPMARAVTGDDEGVLAAVDGEHYCC